MFYRRFTGMAWEPNNSKDPSKTVAGLTLLCVSSILSLLVPSLVHASTYYVHILITHNGLRNCYVYIVYHS